MHNLNAPTSTPSWVYKGAKYDFDFANNRYWGGQFWQGRGTLATGYNPNIMAYNGSSADATTLFTRYKNGTVVQTGSSGTVLYQRRSDYGLWCEGGPGLAHNYALQCRSFGNATWTKTSMTAALDQVGLTGIANTASSLTATAGSGSAVVTQTLSFTSKLVTLSAWIKRITGTGTVGLSIDGASYVDISGSINSSTYTQVRIPTTTTTNPTVGVQLGTNGDKIAIDFFQVEDDDQATSPILTTTTTNLRGAEMPSFGTPASASNFGSQVIQDLYYGTPVTFLVQYSGNFSTTLRHLISIGSDGNNMPLCTGSPSGGTIIVNGSGGNFTSSGSDVSGLFTLNKVAVRYDGNGSSVCINGGTITSSATVKFQLSAQALTHAGQLNNGSNILPVNGYQPRWTAWKRALSDGEMIHYSTVTNNQ